MLLHFEEFLVDHFIVIVDVLVDYIQYGLDLLNFCANVILEVVQHNCYWNRVKYVKFLSFVPLLQIQEYIIFRGQTAMVPDMIDYLLESMFID